MGSLRPVVRAWACAFVAVAAWGAPAAADPSKLKPEIGWNYGDIETARETALGGAVRGFGQSSTALYTNPANMASTQVYHLEALAQIWPEAKRQSYGGSAVDSVTSRVAGGLAGHYTIDDPDGLKRKSTDARVGLAFPISDKFYIGAVGKYLRARQDGLGPLGPSFASGGLSGKPVVAGFTFDTGVTVKPIPSLAIGVVGTNLSNPGTTFQPTSLSGGIGFATGDFSLEGDVLGDFTTYDKTKVRAMAGGELLLGDHFPVRLGYRFDQGQATHAISGGAGYLDQQFAIEVGLRRTVAGEAATAVVIGLQYFLESSGGGSRQVQYE